MQYKRPESVLVVVYVQSSRQVLMLQRRDDPDFWQSVTSSLEDNETPRETALREVKEEIGIDDIINQYLTLVDLQHSLYFDIFFKFRHRYAPGTIQCKEHWFSLALQQEQDFLLKEHLAFRWLPAAQAAALTKSWNNRQAIEQFVLK
ncbi:Dihydroneopterin triphosphate diphosphatase [Arsenophonus endosymbiont of Aleurodicus floccissimus]|uniref:dihydroneopterin triphosphate diphosphatase n=1 Tax=Arsenophonus endosymbiont of Aleurodicus floccissimus TaxID=2152761 RepID=UPI000E6B47DD|nr:dihydroneopterin triphosphate diphosphatase [Arsenophonus endosymbiont of Aleurodicus floccissimus]SPP31159.1 Dihydroneopterin triphosphate diphosphatase [Arsenophonus endosymbiont of Aleurodicus floccissimus]